MRFNVKIVEPCRPIDEIALSCQADLLAESGSANALIHPGLVTGSRIGVHETDLVEILVVAHSRQLNAVAQVELPVEVYTVGTYPPVISECEVAREARIASIGVYKTEEVPAGHRTAKTVTKHTVIVEVRAEILAIGAD